MYISVYKGFGRWWSNNENKDGLSKSRRKRGNIIKHPKDNYVILNIGLRVSKSKEKVVHPRESGP